MVPFLLIVIGFFAGGLGGMLGIGGSLIMIPALTEVLGPDQHLYQASAMIVNVFVAVPAVVQHRRARAIQASVVRRLIPLTIAFVVLGVLLSESRLFAGPSGEPYLRATFGIFLAVIVSLDLYRVVHGWVRGLGANGVKGSPDDLTDTRHATWPRLAGVGVPTGLMAGLMGVGGGGLAVPLQRRLLHLALPVAIANSATVIVGTAAVGATVKNIAYYRLHVVDIGPFHLAAVLIPSAMIGSYIGSRLTHKLPVRAIKTVFLAIMLVLSVRLMRQAYLDITATSGAGAETARGVVDERFDA